MKKNNKIIWFLIIVLLFGLLSHLDGKKLFTNNRNIKSDNINLNNNITNDQYKKANYQYEGTYCNIEYNSVTSNNHKTSEYTNYDLVVIRNTDDLETKSINIYSCFEKKGCKVFLENVLCDEDYVNCTFKRKDSVRDTNIKIVFSDNKISIENKSKFYDNSSLKSSYVGSLCSDSIEIKDYIEIKPTAPKIGMTSDEVEEGTWGKPNKINKTTYEWGTTEQWVYDNNRYVYFKNGKVTAISE